MNPTGTIPTWFIDQFAATFTHVCQQRQSKLEQRVRRETISGEDKSIDEISKFTLRKRTARHQKTVWTDPTTGRRWLLWDTYDGDVMIDKADKLNMLVDPTSDYINGLNMAANRKKDELIIAAAFATVQAGRTMGATTVSWANTKYTGSNPTIQGLLIEHDTAVLGASGVSSSLTVAKLRIARAIFAAKDVPEEIPLYIAVNPNQIWNGLMREEEYINADYSVRKALAAGEVAPFMGFTIVPTTLITLGSSNDKDLDTSVYNCIAWAEDGLALGVAEDVNVQVAPLPEHEFNTGIHLELGMGAVRVDEDKVVKIECI